MIRARWLWVLDALFLLALMIYVLAGIDRVPFHGDESLQIYMSRDYTILIQQRDPAQVRYRDPIDDVLADLDHHLRIVNGTVNKMAIGLAWDLAGMTGADLNGPWFWGFEDEWNWNVGQGHLPSDRLLHVARIPSALFTALSVVLVFALAWRAAGSRVAAWIASMAYATSPAVLVNGRRAMMEGSLLFFSALVVLAAMGLIRAQRGRQRDGRLMMWAIALGAAGGLAMASKHNAVFAVAAAFLAVVIGPWAEKPDRDTPIFARRPSLRGHVFRVLVAGLVMGLVFLALNPAWWGDPLHMPGRVLSERRDLLDRQVQGAGSYENMGDRFEGLVSQTLFAGPQFYEVPAWADYIRDPITAYQGSWLAGRGDSAIWGGLLAALFALGLADLIWRWRAAPAWTVLIWLGVTTLALLALTPLDWQRYYLPLQAPVAVTAGAGAAFVVALAQRVIPGKGRKTQALMHDTFPMRSDDPERGNRPEA